MARRVEEEVAYLKAADNVSGPLASRLIHAAGNLASFL
jgi:hypothetical protein